MTDVVNQSQETQVAPPAIADIGETNERVFSQSEVNEIVKRAKHGAIEGFKKLQSDQPQYAAQKYGETSLSAPNLNDDHIRQLAEEAAVRHIDKVRQEALNKSQEEMAQRVVQNFWAKTQSGKEKYQDFETVTRDIPLGIFPNVVQMLAEQIENADDVLYDMGKSLTKMAAIETLANQEIKSGLSPASALRELKRLANSLKENNEAKNIRVPNEPLNQMRPSISGTDSGAMSVSDYRKKYKV